MIPDILGCVQLSSTQNSPIEINGPELIRSINFNMSILNMKDTGYNPVCLTLLVNSLLEVLTKSPTQNEIMSKISPVILRYFYQF